MVVETPQFGGQPVLVPAGVALWAEEERALVVVHPVDGVAELAGEVAAHFRADQPGGSGHEEGLGHGERERTDSDKSTNGNEPNS